MPSDSLPPLLPMSLYSPVSSRPGTSGSTTSLSSVSTTNSSQPDPHRPLLGGAPRTASSASIVHSLRNRIGSHFKLHKPQPGKNDPVVVRESDDNMKLYQQQVLLQLGGMLQQDTDAWARWANSVGDGAMAAMQINTSP